MKPIAIPSQKQFVFLCFVLVLGWVHIILTSEEARMATLIMFASVALIGTALLKNLSRQLKDPDIQNLIYVFLLKLLLLFPIIHFIWTPHLDESSQLFGYDPQRYYFEAKDFADSGFDLRYLPGINYAGILYYYGVIFTLLGHNAFIPALFNSFVTLLATLLLLRVAYQIKKGRTPGDWTLGLVMFIPEILWYDSITSRETLCMALICFIILPLAAYRSTETKLPFTMGWLTIAVASMLLLGLVRLSMIIPVLFAGIVIFSLSFKPSFRGAILIAVMVAISFIFYRAPKWALEMGSLSPRTHMDMAAGVIIERFRVEELFDGHKSVGLLFVPENYFMFLVYLPIRMIIYMGVPIQHLALYLSELPTGIYSYWQGFLGGISSLLYLSLFPLALSSLIEALMDKAKRGWLLLHAPFWVFAMAIAGGSIVIHERYRIMAIPFFLACLWLGRTSSKSLIKKIYVVWMAILSSGTLLYIAYKMGL